ncbi:hypothetical protein [Streptomyces sp. SolWspMP-sol7th]|uniref:hypothetical protein n=1 Tax=Streptomyces sp. SolWspMP-sol7th TaxID=1839776 RepID=UPI000B899C56|nr:hypothetical protein [Streptomyces sp. SolWspMP-sol7th]
MRGDTGDEAHGAAEPGDEFPARRRRQEIGSLEVWARSAPIRLAGYEDDLAEPHILPSVD